MLAPPDAETALRLTDALWSQTPVAVRAIFAVIAVSAVAAYLRRLLSRRGLVR